MAKESIMLELGSVAPDFSLPDTVSGKSVALSDFADNSALLVMFICRHCPYVVHLQQGLAKLGQDYAASGLAIVAISANDATQYPDDAPDKLAEMARRLLFNFSFCYDQEQVVAKAYQASCTPDFFLYNDQRRLVYHGQFDDSRPGKDIPVTGKDLRLAIDATLIGKTPSTKQYPSIGCGIKWK